MLLKLVIIQRLAVILNNINLLFFKMTYDTSYHVIFSVYPMDIVKQRVTMNKDITWRNCDIWQWDSIGVWSKYRQSYVGFFSVGACEDLCESSPTCNSVLIDYQGHHRNVQCKLSESVLRETVHGRNNINAPKFHFCYGECHFIIF